MKMRKFATILGASLTLSAGGALAEEAAGPPKEAKDLQCLVGTWRGDGIMEINGEKTPVSATYECRSAAGGFGVACGFTMSGLPGMTYEMQDIWGYDPGDGSYHWYTVTNAGETHDHKGRIAKDTFTGRYVGKRAGKKMVEDVSVGFANDTTLKASSVVSVGGKPAERLEITLRKDASLAGRARR